MYGNPYDDSELGKLKQLIELYESRISMLEVYNEDNLKRPYRERGPFQSIAYERVMLAEFESEVDRIKNHVRCQRFPEFVKRHKEDVCGEFAND
jgi:hypothetical protein